jgi:outer membrane biosynthesis protein TonB
MKQGRKSRCAWALLSALFALGAAAPAASAAPAAVEEYDLALPDPNGPSDPNAPVPEDAPAPPAPVAPAPTEAAPTETAPLETVVTPSGKPKPEREKLYQAAIRRDVLFERPEKISTPLPKAPYQRTRDSASASTALLGFVAIGAVCVAASLWRIRRVARDAAAHSAPAGVSDPQASS